MEINYNFFEGKYLKHSNGKALKSTEILNLKQFQDEVDKKVKRFELVAQGYFFPLSLLKRSLIHLVIGFMSLFLLYLMIYFFKIDVYNIENDSQARQLKFALNRKGNSTGENLEVAGLTFEAFKFLECSEKQIRNGNKPGIACKFKELKSKPVIERNETLKTEKPQPQENPQTLKENINLGANLDNKNSSIENSDFFKPIFKIINAPENAYQNENQDNNTKEQTRQPSFINPDEEAIKEQLNNENNFVDEIKQEPENQNQPEIPTNVNNAFYNQENQSNFETTDNNPPQQPQNYFSNSAAEPQLLDYYSEEQSAPKNNKKPSKGIKVPKPQVSEDDQTEVNDDDFYRQFQDKFHQSIPAKKSSHSKLQKTNNNFRQTKETPTDSYNYRTSPSSFTTIKPKKSKTKNTFEYYPENNPHSRKLQETLEETIPSEKQQEVPSNDLQSVLLVINKKIYELSTPSGKTLGFFRKLMLTLLGISIMAIVTLASIYVITEKGIYTKVNDTIIDMVIDENSESGIYKFFIYGDFQYIGVKINVLSEVNTDGKLNSLNSDSYMLDQNLLHSRKLHLIKKNKTKKVAQRSNPYRNVSQVNNDSFNLDGSSLFLNDSNN